MHMPINPSIHQSIKEKEAEEGWVSVVIKNEKRGGCKSTLKRTIGSTEAITHNTERERHARRPQLHARVRAINRSIEEEEG